MTLTYANATATFDAGILTVQHSDGRSETHAYEGFECRPNATHRQRMARSVFPGVNDVLDTAQVTLPNGRGG
jgi:hypothetical protein